MSLIKGSTNLRAAPPNRKPVPQNTNCYSEKNPILRQLQIYFTLLLVFLPSAVAASQPNTSRFIFSTKKEITNDVAVFFLLAPLQACGGNPRIKKG